jgi:outer membrane protein insertion porin family
MEIERGPPVTIERIEIRGNSRTRDKVIRRELKHHGGRALQPDPRRALEGPRHWPSATSSAWTFSEAGGSRAGLAWCISVDVGERATGHIPTWVPASRPSRASSSTGQIQQQNFLGTRPLASGCSLQLSGIRQLIQFQYVEPYLFDTEWTGIGEAFLTVRQFDDLHPANARAARSRFGHPVLHDDLRLYLRYKLENVDISSRTGGLFGSAATPRGLNLLQRLAPWRTSFATGITSSVAALAGVGLPRQPPVRAETASTRASRRRCPTPTSGP